MILQQLSGMKKITTTERRVRDLTFLLDLPKQELSDGIIKRTETEGTGLVIKAIKAPCSIYFSYYKYDYEGRIHSKSIKNCIRNIYKREGSQIPTCVFIAIESMKLEEKSWFNVKSQDLHQVPNMPHGGCHFYIILEDIKYQNEDTMTAKELVSKQCREQAKKLFQNGDYLRAMKIYKKQINITEGFDKKKFKPEELQAIKSMNLKAKTNFLRCFSKLTTVDDAMCQVAEIYSKQLCKAYSDDEVNRDIVQFLRIHVLVQTKYLTLAYETAEQFLKTAKETHHEEIVKLMGHIKQKINGKNQK